MGLGGISIWQLLIILVIVIAIFGFVTMGAGIVAAFLPAIRRS